MQTLNMEQIEEVNGGIIPIVIGVVALGIGTAALSVAMIANADKLQEFIGGFLDGLTAK
jgi:lactobin A/cerein 7B family class IIb bacteriocin